jgi:hypothetical protein
MACCNTSIRFSNSTGGSDPSSDVLPDAQASNTEAKAQFRFSIIWSVKALKQAENMCSTPSIGKPLAGLIPD